LNSESDRQETGASHLCIFSLNTANRELRIENSPYLNSQFSILDLLADGLEWDREAIAHNIGYNMREIKSSKLRITDDYISKDN